MLPYPDKGLFITNVILNSDMLETVKNNTECPQSSVLLNTVPENLDSIEKQGKGNKYWTGSVTALRICPVGFLAYGGNPHPVKKKKRKTGQEIETVIT